MAKCAHQYTPLVPIEITSETSERVYRNDVDQELLCIALHGDYKYGSLKNTENELDTQDGELEKALRHQLQNRDLIVIGYSGNKKTITGYQGVQLSLQFDVKYCYLTFAPSYTYADEAVYSKEEKKAFADYYNAGVNNGRPNKNTYDYISNWVTRVTGNSNLKLCFPIQDTSPFIFNISCKSAMLGVNFGGKYPVRLSSGFSPKRIVFTGREYNDPTLLFYNPSSGKTAGDFHPMRGLINNGPIDLPLYSIPLAVIVSKTHIVLIMLRKRTEIEIELLLIYRKYLFFLIYIITQKSRVRHPLHDFFLFCAGMS